MFQAQVADLYRGKGYAVREKPRVRGASENVYAVDLVAEGPLGALLVSFGDAGGIDIHEVARVKTLARDVGATPVLAAPTFPNDVRRAADAMGVVLLDEASLDEPVAVDNVPVGLVASESVQRDLEAHPWPASGRARPLLAAEDVKAVDVDEMLEDLSRANRKPAPAPSPSAAALWKSASGAASAEPALAKPARPDAFAWLGAKPPAPAPALPDAQPALEHAEEVHAAHRPSSTPAPPEAALPGAPRRRKAVPERRVPRWAVYGSLLFVLFLAWRLLL